MIKGVVYRIFSPTRPELGCYIGSTLLGIKRRMAIHRCSHRAFLKGAAGYCSSFRVLGAANDAVCEPLQEVEVERKDELKRLEGDYIRTVEGCVNAKVAGRTDRERYKEKEGELRERARAYYQLNRDRKREYYLKNKERMIAYAKSRYYANKDCVQKTI